MKSPAHNLKNISFPNCNSKCAIIKYIRVGECESICPYKFDKNGEPIILKKYINVQEEAINRLENQGNM